MIGALGRARVAAIALAALLPLRAAGAQDTTLPATVPAARPALDGARLSPERRVYQLTVLRGGLPTTVGERTVTVRDASHGGLPAWSIVELRRVAAATSVDSAIVARGDLAPLHWEGTVAGARLVAGVSRDTLYGVVASPAARRSIAAGGVGGAVLNAAMLEVMLPLMPLQVGWSAPLALVVVDAAGARVVPAQLVVEREESVQVPAGRFDCWVVTLRVMRATRTLWVSRDGRGVVRSEERMPDIDGAVLEQALVATGRP
ncbi:MAG TPA: hypothetical protein VEA99_04730 [Gemmatimonadaceae bacterium]|nr:hypothetical protein [Gemmatimonadaceae bacterium]